MKDEGSTEIRYAVQAWVFGVWWQLYWYKAEQYDVIRCLGHVC